MQINGMESVRASAIAATRLVAPGPLQAIQTAGLPSVRAIPCTNPAPVHGAPEYTGRVLLLNAS